MNVMFSEEISLYKNTSDEDKKKNISEEKKQPKTSISSTIEENTNIVGKKFEEKRRQTINDVRREIMNFVQNNK